MFPGTQVYPEGRIPPGRGLGNNWHVNCATGALHVLNSNDHVDVLMRKQEGAFSINFANGSFANIWPAHPLWVALKALVAEGFSIEVFTLSLRGSYVAWTGEEGSLGRFDAIKITKKP